MRRRKVGRLEGLMLGILLSNIPTFQLSAQDTSTIDRGVRIGIIYRPGVRPGMVMLPRKGMGLDSVRAMVARDLDYSDRFELISLPGGDSIRLAAPSAPGPSPAAGAGTGKATGGAAAAAGLDYPLYHGPGAGFAVGLGPGGARTTVITAHRV